MPPLKTFACREKAESYVKTEKAEALKDIRRTQDSIWDIRVEPIEFDEEEGTSIS